MTEQISPPLVVIGTGDHAHVILEALRAAGRPVSGLIGVRPVTGSEAYPTDLLVLGDLTTDLAWRDRLGPALFVVGIGNTAIRFEAYERAIGLGLTPEAVVHPTASLLGGCTVGVGSQICAGAVIGVHARIGVNAIINTAATVDHDNVIGDHASIGPGAHLAGRVTVGPYSHIGLASSVNEGVTIGSRCLVASGAAVVRDIPDGMRVAGVPARPMIEGHSGRERAEQ